MTKHRHDAEYFRLWRAKQRDKRALTSPVVGPDRRNEWRIDPASHFPIEVLRRGQVLTAMMRTPIAMWPKEFYDDI